MINADGSVKPNRKVDRRLLLLLGLVVIGGWLRIWRVNAQSLWFDEVFSRNVAVDESIGSILTDGVAGDVHPPLYFVLLNAWTHLVGDSALALRMLGVFFSILVLPAVYHLARLLFGLRAGVIALVLAAVSPFQIYYAQEARQYVLSILCMAWAAVGLVRIVQGKRGGWLLYVIASAAGLYTHYFVGLALAAIHLWLLLYPPARRSWRRWLSADVAIALLFAPQAVIFAGQAQAVLGGFWIDRPSPAAPLVTPVFLLFSNILPLAIGYLCAALIICLIVIGALDVLRRAPRQAWANWWLCIIVLYGTLIPALVVSLVRSPIYLDRSFALLSPFLLALLAGGLAYARRPSPSPLLAGLLVVAMIGAEVRYSVWLDPAKAPYNQVASDLLSQPDALAVPVLHLNDSSYLPLTYYAPDLDQRLVNTEDHSWLFPKTWQIFGVNRLSRSQLTDWLASYRGILRIVVVTSSIEPPEVATLNSLEQKACALSGKGYPDDQSALVVVYTATLGPCVAVLPR